MMEETTPFCRFTTIAKNVKLSKIIRKGTARVKGNRKPRVQGRRGFDLLECLESAKPWKRGLAVAVFLVLMLCLFMPELVFLDNIFLVPDSKAPISFYSVGRESLQKGTYPLWNPYLFCGMPSYPSLAYTPYVYPVSFITHVLYTYAGFPEMAWLLIHYLMAGIGVYLLMRTLGVRSSVSMMAGAVFMLMPNYLAIGGNGHGSQACAIAYMPYALMFARNIVRGHKRLSMAAFLGITLGFQLLRGHVQISYYTYLLLGFLFLFEAVYMLKDGKRKDTLVVLGFYAIAFILALSIAAVLILPVREYAPLSIRGAGDSGGLDYNYATGWSLHPKEMLTFIFAWAFGFGKATYFGKMPFTDYPNYLGVCTVIFSITAAFLVRNRWKWFLILSAAICTVISFGRFFPLFYNFMFHYIPYFNKFRVPVMILIVQQLAVVLLMGMGLEELLNLTSSGKLPAWLRGRSLKWAMLAGGVLFVMVLLMKGGIEDGVARSMIDSGRVNRQFAGLGAGAFANDLLKTILILAAVTAALYLSSINRIGTGALIVFFMLVSLLDMFMVSRPILHPESTWRAEGYRIIKPASEREEFEKPGEVIGFLKRDPSLFRIFPVPAAPVGRWSYSTPPYSDNSYMISRIYSLGGYHAAKLKNYQDVIDVMFSSFNMGRIPVQILNMLNAKYLVSRFKMFKDDSPYPLEWQGRDNFVYRNTGVLPRVYLVDRFRVMTGEKALRTLLSQSFDPSREVLLLEEPATAVESAEGSHAEITEYSLNALSIDAHIEKACILVLSEIDYPDWKAEVDGVETEIHTANYCLRALVLSPGDHRIRFLISSGTLKLSLILSVISFAVAVAIPTGSLLFRERKGK